MRRTRPVGASGFTLIELLVTMGVAGILMAMAGASLSSWASSNEHKSSRDEVLSGLRNTAQRALSEGRTYCMAFTANGTWSTYRTTCTGVPMASGQGPKPGRTTVASTFAVPPASCTGAASTTACVLFTARGTATAGTVTLTRSGKPTYTVTVEQLTSRVYSN